MRPPVVRKRMNSLQLMNSRFHGRDSLVFTSILKPQNRFRWFIVSSPTDVQFLPHNVPFTPSLDSKNKSHFRQVPTACNNLMNDGWRRRSWTGGPGTDERVPPPSLGRGRADRHNRRVLRTNLQVVADGADHRHSVWRYMSLCNDVHYWTLTSIHNVVVVLIDILHRVKSFSIGGFIDD